MTAALAERFTDWTTMRRAQGWEVEHDLPTRGGWPFAARLTVPGLRISASDPAVAVDFALEVPRLVLQIAAPRLDRLVMRPQGEQRLRLGTTEVVFTAERLEAALALEPGLPPRAIEVLAERLRAATPDGPFEAQSLVLALSSRFAPPDAEPAVTIDLAAQGVALPAGAASPAMAAFGRRMEEARLEAVLTRALPMSGPPAAIAAAWRDAGGALDLRSVALRWGALAGEAQMTLTLDAALQPAGAGTLRLSDAPAALEAMASAGVITRGAARTAQGVAMFVARVPDGGGAPQVELPFTLANGIVTVARIPLLRLAPLAWTGGGLPHAASPLR
nr:DUF2125 domain-containing protein [Neoroseomonas soli]